LILSLSPPLLSLSPALSLAPPPSSLSLAFHPLSLSHLLISLDLIIIFTSLYLFLPLPLNTTSLPLPSSLPLSGNNQRVLRECEASSDRQCVCKTGYYCSDDGCEHCRPVALCPLGSGVVNQATPQNDTVCAPCRPGTYNSVNDAITHCQSHTRCGDLGREVKSAGTETTDAVCGAFISRCPWILPTSLWAGLVVTSLIIILICIYWRAKRQSYMPANSSGPGIPVEPAPPSFAPAELKFPTECNSHWSLDQKATEPLFINTGESPSVVVGIVHHNYKCTSSSAQERRYSVHPESRLGLFTELQVSIGIVECRTI
uniref:Tumor necrosis factor receptor superfamily member 5-like n=1 Tax=Salmo trutta TaxID=8032 RepID=A0A673ZA13_SALTR